ncbi:hypothetical protein BDFB_003940 [Asbolus verrucosus]|uniref:Aromatic-L-amino-acid decarboxylase n=1 Tax=Asbolus verrucosus TaxID=1661398 RepID=A0A482WCY4_ASBVE|nr:hypothetical protein BDFB_003940 [Asbolus verrucosus]
MDIEQFRKASLKVIYFICEYLSNIATETVNADVNPNIKPGYLENLLPGEAPEDPEEWDNIMDDFVKKIMPGITHWQHPGFHAYFPSGNSFPSILADMLSNAIGCIGFSWQAAPACTELEIIVTDWLAKEVGLPNDFLSSSEGGGVIQTSTSECVLVCMLAARNQAIKTLKEQNQNLEDSAFVQKLVAYCSQEASSCVEKAAKLFLVKLRILDSDENGCLRGDTLKVAMEEDKAKGLTPFFVLAMLGSTYTCSFDDLEEIGQVCKEQQYCWLHVDAAYAGNALICPEFKHLLKGMEYVDSFNINPSEWLLVNFDCSCLWVRKRALLINALSINPLYLQHSNDNEATDYRHWGIPLSRRFRALKLWFVIRKYGIFGLRSHINNHIELAKYFETLVRKDARFEIVNDVTLGLVCFRLSNGCTASKELFQLINKSGKIFVTLAKTKNVHFIRFCVNSEDAKKESMDFSWKIIQELADHVVVSPAKQELINVLFTKNVLEKTRSL